MSEPELIGVRTTPAHMGLLEKLVERMQTRNPNLSVDDCIDAIFTAGLLSCTYFEEMNVQ